MHWQALQPLILDLFRVNHIPNIPNINKINCLQFHHDQDVYTHLLVRFFHFCIWKAKKSKGCPKEGQNPLNLLEKKNSRLLIAFCKPDSFASFALTNLGFSLAQAKKSQEGNYRYLVYVLSNLVLNRTQNTGSEWYTWSSWYESALSSLKILNWRSSTRR